MKHISRKVLSLLGLSLMLVGCGGNTSSATNGSSAEARTSTSTVQEVKVTRLVVSAKPTKTKYSVGEKFDPTGMVVTAIYSNGIREEVKDYTYDKTGELTTEDTTVTISYLNATTTIKIEIKGYDFKAKEAGTVRLEAENMELSNLTSDGSSSFIQQDSRSSNGQSIGHLTGGNISVNFTTDSAYTLSVTGAFAKYEEVNLSDFLKFTIDGKEATFEDIVLGRVEDGSNDWFNWKTTTISCGSLEAGSHAFIITFLNGLNVDYLDFVFSK